MSVPVIALPAFIQATRDSGYKCTAAAISELVDNALEASATRVEIHVFRTQTGVEIKVLDNGSGMAKDTLSLALQFGGSTRFDSRNSLGRYGMGLPNGSLSQARCVEVLSWRDSGAVWKVRLNVDEVLSRVNACLLPPIAISEFRPPTVSGTLVHLRSCDRLDSARTSTIERRLHRELGRIFRKFLYRGASILVNGKQVRPFDPLFLREGQNLVGAPEFGPPFEYRVRTMNGKDGKEGLIRVRFVELPIDLWHTLSNERKNDLRISKSAGVSVLRGDREIDFGWYFMGSKRKENYDDWWRCEVSFEAKLDEFFGVTHTKQKINPSDALNAILSPDMERVARELNGRIRKTYSVVRENSKRTRLYRAEARDHLLEPPGRLLQSPSTLSSSALRRRDGGIKGMKYRIRIDALDDDAIYVPVRERDRLTIILNANHPFVKTGFQAGTNAGCSKEQLYLLFAAAARTEISLRNPRARTIVREFLHTGAERCPLMPSPRTKPPVAFNPTLGRNKSKLVAFAKEIRSMLRANQDAVLNAATFQQLRRRACEQRVSLSVAALKLIVAENLLLDLVAQGWNISVRKQRITLRRSSESDSKDVIR